MENFDKEKKIKKRSGKEETQKIMTRKSTNLQKTTNRTFEKKKRIDPALKGKSEGDKRRKGARENFGGFLKNLRGIVGYLDSGDYFQLGTIEKENDMKGQKKD